MKIAFPTNGTNLNAELFLHFGKSKNYLIYDTDTKDFEIKLNTSEHMWGKWLPPELIKKFGAQVIIVCELWPKALELFNKLNIEVYCAKSWIIGDIIDLFNDQKILKANSDMVCDSYK